MAAALLVQLNQLILNGRIPDWGGLGVLELIKEGEIRGISLIHNVHH